MMSSPKPPAASRRDDGSNLRVEITAQNIKCFLDDKLIHDLNQASLPSLFASATQDNKNGDLILKVVNGNEQSLDTRVDFQGAKKLAGTGREIVLASDKPTDENTLANPTKVSPKSRTVGGDRAQFPPRLPRQLRHHPSHRRPLGVTALSGACSAPSLVRDLWTQSGGPILGSPPPRVSGWATKILGGFQRRVSRVGMKP